MNRIKYLKVNKTIHKCYCFTFEVAVNILSLIDHQNLFLFQAGLIDVLLLNCLQRS